MPGSRVSFLVLVCISVVGLAENVTEECRIDALGRATCQDRSNLLQSHLHVSSDGKSVLGVMFQSAGVLKRRFLDVVAHDWKVHPEDVTQLSQAEKSTSWYRFHITWQMVLVEVIAAASLLLIIAMISIFVGTDAVVVIILAGVYLLWAPGLQFISKHLVGQDHYVHPVVLVTLHQLTCTLASWGSYLARPQMFPALDTIKAGGVGDEDYRRARRFIIANALCFAGTLTFDNVAYFYSSIALLQMLKEASLVLIAVFGVMLGTEVLGFKRIGLLVLIIIGSCMCVKGEVHSTALGVFAQFLSNFCQASRLVAQQFLLQHAGLKLDPLSYMAIVAPLCLGALLPVAIAICLIHHNTFAAIKASMGLLALSCFLAVGLNFLNSLIIQRTSALGFCLLGILKNAFILFVSFCILGLPTTFCQLSGCVIIVYAALHYSILKQLEGTSSVKSPAITTGSAK